MSRFSQAAILALLCLPFSASAQLPTSVDIDLEPGATATTMNARLKANGQSFNEVISGLTFTVEHSRLAFPRICLVVARMVKHCLPILG